MVMVMKITMASSSSSGMQISAIHQAAIARTQQYWQRA